MTANSRSTSLCASELVGSSNTINRARVQTPARFPRVVALRSQPPHDRFRARDQNVPASKCPAHTRPLHAPLQKSKAAGFPAEHDIVFHAQIRRYVQLLIDHRHAGLPRCCGPDGVIARRSIAIVPASVRWCPLRIFMERAFAGAVLADQREHLAAAHLERNIRQRHGCPEPLADPGHSKQRRGHCVSRLSLLSRSDSPSRRAASTPPL